MATFDYEASWGGIPFDLDVGRVVRMHAATPEQEDAGSRPPRKHQPEADIAAEIDRLMTLQYLDEFSSGPTTAGVPSKFGTNRNDLYPGVSPPIYFGDFYYPHGMTRYGLFRALASSTLVKAMAALGSGPQTLVLRSDPVGATQGAAGGISTSMYLLPPRPISEVGGTFDGLYLLTFVDERYFLQGVTATLSLSDKTWPGVATELGKVLGNSLPAATPLSVAYANRNATYDTYLPDSGFWQGRESAAALLDLLAYVTGCVVVRNLDGTYTLQDWATAQAVVQANRGIAPVRTAGGELSSADASLAAGDLSGTANLAAPHKVTVLFPGGSDGSAVTATTPVAYAQAGGTGEQTVYLPAFPDPQNASPVGALQLAYATQLGSDYVAYLTATAVDESYPGVVAWTPEGIHAVVWSYSGRRRQATTRAIRTRDIPPLTSIDAGLPPFPGGGGALDAQQVDPLADYPDTGTLQFDHADGFVLSRPAPNTTLVKFDSHLKSGGESCCCQYSPVSGYYLSASGLILSGSAVSGGYIINASGYFASGEVLSGKYYLTASGTVGSGLPPWWGVVPSGAFYQMSGGAVASGASQSGFYYLAASGYSASGTAVSGDVASGGYYRTGSGTVAKGIPPFWSVQLPPDGTASGLPITTSGKPCYTNALTSGYPGGWTGEYSLVESLSFSAGSCTLTVTSQTFVFANGLLVDVFP